MERFRARKQKSGNTYYYFDTGQKPRREIPLGNDYVIAVRKWTELIGGEETAAPVSDFEALARKYEREQIPLKAKSTQATNRSDLKLLRQFFCDPTPAPLDQIKPTHIKAMLRWKADQPTTANRLKRLFSHMFNMAREWGYTEATNPVAGIKGYELPKRQVYVSDAVYRAVWQCASQPLRDAMDLAYLTGQRPGDVLKFSEHQIQDGVFVIAAQAKTGKPLRIRIEGEFGALMERIAARKAGHRVWSTALAVNMHGMAMSKQVLRNHFELARTAAAVQFPKLAAEISQMWFYDLRAKAADDVSDDRGDQAAADLLGHENVRTTQRHYLRRGKQVGPTK
ncbi:MAG: hypothetical protein RL375_3698 [Pseudomonadota bacterium]|jgi:integrase